MKKITGIITVLCFSLLSLSLVAQVRDLDNFNRLDVSMGIEVNLVQSSDTKADINIKKGEYDDLITEVNGSTLKIKWKKDNWWGGNGNRKATVTLYYKKLDGFDVSSGSSVKGDDVIKSSDMDIDVSSGASINIEIETNDLDVDISSGASCYLSGKAEEQKVDVSSGATYDGLKLATRETTVDASSGASAKVWVTDKFNADASSGASIRYKGDPSDTKIEAGKWSGGSIKKIGNS